MPIRMPAAILVLLVAATGCGLGVVDPGDAIILPDDDDDSAPGADDDDVGPDDDDSVDDDDDDATEDPGSRTGVLWLLDRQDLLIADSSDKLFAAASFTEDGSVGIDDYEGYLGLPFPGLLLHPALDPGFEGGEGCETISSSEGRPTLPSSDDVGEAISLLSDGGATDVTVERVGDVYRLEAEGPSGGDSWSLAIPGGSDWPGSETPEALSGPPAPAGVLPTPGTLSALSSVHVGWTPGDEEAIEVVMVRYASPADTGSWEGLRCLALDDGTYTIDASALAAAGSGDIQIFVSRARWAVLDAVPSEGRPALDAGFVRSVSFQMTPGG